MMLEHLYQFYTIPLWMQLLCGGYQDVVPGIRMRVSYSGQGLGGFCQTLCRHVLSFLRPIA